MIATDYKDLFIWKQSLKISIEAYQITQKLPLSEKYGICSQIQRAAVSIPSNIAEGYNRRSRKEFLRYLNIACGSLAELETQIIICSNVYSYGENEFKAYLTDIDKLRGLLIVTIKKLSL